MTWILVIITLGIFISSLFTIKEKFNPLTLFSGFWLIIMFLSTLELYNIKRAETEVYLIVSIGVFCYAIGCFISSRIKLKIILNSKFNNSYVKNDNINYKMLYKVIIVVSIVMVMYFLRVAASMLLGYPLNYIRSNFSTIIIKSELERLSWTFIFYPLSISIMPMGLYAFYVGRRSLWYFWASLLNTILLSISSGGRVFLMYYIIEFVFFVMLTKDRLSGLKKLYRNLSVALIAIVCIGIMVYISNERQIQSSPLENLYSYFVGCFPYFEYKLKSIDMVDQGFGMYFLNAPITLVLMVFKNIGLINYPESYLKVQSTINALQEYTRIGNNWFNAFGTCFYYYYADYGLIGVELCSLLYGFFSYNVFKNLQKKVSARNTILYSIILISIFTSMIRWQFARPEFFMSVVYIIALTRNKSVMMEES